MPSGEGLAQHAELLCKINSKEILDQIKVPMLILAPANSAMTSVDEQKEIQSKVSGSKIVVVEGKGHEIFVDKAEECQKAFLDFLAGLKKS